MLITIASFLFLLVFLLVFLLLIGTVLMHLLFLVPYVPSSKRSIETMIRAARLKPRQTVFDLGCGDGRLLIEAEKQKGVTAWGFEIAPLVYLLARARALFSDSKTKIYFKNFFHANLRPANVIFCYLFPNVMPRLAEKIKKECRKGTRVISNTFHIPGLKLERVFKKDPVRGRPTIYVYEV